MVTIGLQMINIKKMRRRAGCVGEGVPAPIRCEHGRPTYIVHPDMFSVVAETSLAIWVGFIESDKVLTIYLFIYLFICI